MSRAPHIAIEVVDVDVNDDGLIDDLDQTIFDLGYPSTSVDPGYERCFDIDRDDDIDDDDKDWFDGTKADQYAHDLSIVRQRVKTETIQELEWSDGWRAWIVALDEDEVIKFTGKDNPITYGWIHVHKYPYVADEYVCYHFCVDTMVGSYKALGHGCLMRAQSFSGNHSYNVFWVGGDWQDLNNWRILEPQSGIIYNAVGQTGIYNTDWVWFPGEKNGSYQLHKLSVDTPGEALDYSIPSTWSPDPTQFEEPLPDEFDPQLGISRYVSPTSHYDEDNVWGAEEQAYNEEPIDAAYTMEAGHYLYLSHPDILCNKIRIYAEDRTGDDVVDPDIAIDVYYDSAYYTIFSGTITNGIWVEKSIPVGYKSVDKARVKFNSLTKLYGCIFEFDFWSELPEPHLGAATLAGIGTLVAIGGVTHYASAVLSGIASLTLIGRLGTSEILRPNAAGDETSLNKQYPVSGEHWEKVDEESADDAATIVQNDRVVSYQRDLYNLPASSGEGTISKITVYFKAFIGTGMSYSYGKASIKSGTTVEDGDEESLTAWALYSHEWALNPDDSENWEWADIDALQIGVSLKATTLQNPSCTQVYVEVNYIEAVTCYGLAALSGTGSLTAIGGRIIAGAQAMLSGTGTLSAIGRVVIGGVTHYASAVLSGMGALYGAGRLIAIGKVALSGISGLSAIGQRTIYGLTILSGASTLGAKSVLTAIGKLALLGTGSLIAKGARIFAGKAALMGNGILDAIGHITAIGKTTLSGIGTLVAIGVRIRTSLVTLSGVGTLGAIGTLAAIAKVMLAGTGTLSAIGRRIYVGKAILSGTGSLSVAGMLGVIKYGIATLLGMGTLTSIGIIIARIKNIQAVRVKLSRLNRPRLIMTSVKRTREV